MNKALEALKEIEWMGTFERCPVCGQFRSLQHAQWCRLDRAIGWLERESDQPEETRKTIELLEEIDEMQFPFSVRNGRPLTVIPQAQTKKIIANVKEVLALLAKQPKAGEFTKTLDAIQIYFDDDCRAFLDSEWYDFKKLWKEVRTTIARLKMELDYQGKIGSQQFEAQRVEIECLRAQLAGKRE